MQPLRDPRAFLLIVVWLAALVAQIRTSVFDTVVLGWLYAGTSPALVVAGSLVTALGGWKVLVPVTLGGVFLLWRRGTGRHARYLLAFAFWGRVVVDLVKLMIARLRPDEMPQLAETFSASFPSGHAANSTITYCAIALLLAPGRRWALGLALALAAVIGLSRLLLGVHWPSDVVGGWALGLLWTLALHRLVGQEGTPAPSLSLKTRKESET